jgi:hypothetical protein
MRIPKWSRRASAMSDAPPLKINGLPAHAYLGSSERSDAIYRDALVAAAQALPASAVPLARGLVESIDVTLMPPASRFALLHLLSLIGSVEPSPTWGLFARLRALAAGNTTGAAVRQSAEWDVLRATQRDADAIAALTFLEAVAGACKGLHQREAASQPDVSTAWRC